MIGFVLNIDQDVVVLKIIESKVYHRYLCRRNFRFPKAYDLLILKSDQFLNVKCEHRLQLKVVLLIFRRLGQVLDADGKVSYRNGFFVKVPCLDFNEKLLGVDVDKEKHDNT